MIKWYDRIGNTIEMNIDNQWIKGTIVNGYRTHDGLINMKTEDGKNCWCGVNGEYVHFRKCEDSLGDLLTNADRIRAMSDEELEILIRDVHRCGVLVGSDNYESCIGCCKPYCQDILKWLKMDIK